MLYCIETGRFTYNRTFTRASNFGPMVDNRVKQGMSPSQRPQGADGRDMPVSVSRYLSMQDQILDRVKLRAVVGLGVMRLGVMRLGVGVELGLG